MQLLHINFGTFDLAKTKQDKLLKSQINSQKIINYRILKLGILEKKQLKDKLKNYCFYLFKETIN